MLDTALTIAVLFHSKQKDKNGKHYILHPLAVMNEMDTEKEKVVAILHDVVEDTSVTLTQLMSYEVFSGEIIHAIDCLTKQEGELYADYIERVKSDKLATRVKLADLKHNSRLDRTYEGGENLLKRYAKAYTYLTED